MSNQTPAMMYAVFVRTGAYGFDEYKVYSHHLSNQTLVLNFGTLKNGARNELGIPISRILDYHTQDIEEEVNGK